MISTWTIAPPHGAECGYDAGRIPAGDPMEVLSRPALTRKYYRCVVHAHSPMDTSAVTAARQAADARQAIVDAQPEPVPTLTNTRPTYAKRHRPTTAPKDFATIADVAGTIFDPRAAQANDHD